MWQVLMYKSTYKWLFYGLIGFIIISFLLYFNHLRKDNVKMKQELYLLKNQLATCQKANAELTQQIELDRQKYKKKIVQLLKEANKSPKVIEIPKIVEKPVYVPTEDCQKMAIMIDEFIKIQKEGKR
ncbi:MAG: hypothetical protein DRP34_04915 [Thermodesulfobacteriota bacterium]|nr:MAG: hypothetical protein DRP34_04915 [Thermodesulfobacteriota bacterium]